MRINQICLYFDFWRLSYRLRFSNESKFIANSLLLVELYVASSLAYNHDF